MAGNCGDDWLGQGFYLIEENLELPRMLVRRLSAGSSFHFADVCAGAEYFVIPCDNDRPNRRVTRNIAEQSLHLLPHLSIQRIFLLRSMELNRGDCVILAVLQGLIHIVLSLKAKQLHGIVV